MNERQRWLARSVEDDLKTIEQEAADGYLDDWDYPDEHQRKRHSGLLEDEA